MTSVVPIGAGGVPKQGEAVCCVSQSPKSFGQTIPVEFVAYNGGACQVKGADGIQYEVRHDHLYRESK